MLNLVIIKIVAESFKLGVVDAGITSAELKVHVILAKYKLTTVHLAF